MTAISEREGSGSATSATQKIKTLRTNFRRTGNASRNSCDVEERLLHLGPAVEGRCRGRREAAKNTTVLDDARTTRSCWPRAAEDPSRGSPPGIAASPGVPIGQKTSGSVIGEPSPALREDRDARVVRATVSSVVERAVVRIVVDRAGSHTPPAGCPSRTASPKCSCSPPNGRRTARRACRRTRRTRREVQDEAVDLAVPQVASARCRVG